MVLFGLIINIFLITNTQEMSAKIIKKTIVVFEFRAYT